VSSRIEGNVFVDGSLQAKTLVPSDGCVTNAKVVTDAQLDAAKLRHRNRGHFTQPNTTATAERKIVYVARHSGNVLSFVAGSIAICAGAATMTVDLQKNGVSVLTAVITLNSSSVNLVAQAATISVAAYVAGDVFEIISTATAGGGTIGTGLFASAEFDEQAVQ
jgi:hypothetical protein